MNKGKFSRYNDGVLSVYREKPRRTDFGAKQNVSGLADMDFIVKLAFEESSRREQDVEFAEQVGFSLSLKVRTRYFAGVDNKCKAVLNGYLYDIKHTDKSRDEMWLFLEEIREIEVNK